MTPPPASLSDLTIRDVTTRGVIVPMARPLATRIVVLEKAALLLIDLHTEEGVTGRTYLFGYLERGIAYMAALVRDIVAMTRGDTVAPQDLYAKVRKGLSLMGHEGLSTMAAAGFDMACWDALARAAGVPLVTLLGGTSRDRSRRITATVLALSNRQPPPTKPGPWSPRAISRPSRCASAARPWNRTWRRCAPSDTPSETISWCPRTSIKD